MGRAGPRGWLVVNGRCGALEGTCGIQQRRPSVEWGAPVVVADGVQRNLQGVRPLPGNNLPFHFGKLLFGRPYRTSRARERGGAAMPRGGDGFEVRLPGKKTASRSSPGAGFTGRLLV